MNQDEETFRLQLPACSWINLLSLDAVMVGVLWLLLFTQQYLDRLPSLAEVGVIAISIWLAYTADRLLDSLKLDIAKPHTMRHRFHFMHRNKLVTAWLAGLIVNTFLVVSFATSEQLRCGYLVIALVLAYIIGVHVPMRGRSSRARIPKELQAGLLFAIGVSFVAWSGWSDLTESWTSLVFSTLTCGLLFAANCYVVAAAERDLDQAQGFASFSGGTSPMDTSWLPRLILAHLLISSSFAWMQLIPLPIGVCLVISAVLLLATSLGLPTAQPSAKRVDFRAIGMAADVALLVPPLAGVAIVHWAFS